MTIRYLTNAVQIRLVAHKVNPFQTGLELTATLTSIFGSCQHRLRSRGTDRRLNPGAGRAVHWGRRVRDRRGAGRHPGQRRRAHWDRREHGDPERDHRQEREDRQELRPHKRERECRLGRFRIFSLGESLSDIEIIKRGVYGVERLLSLASRRLRSSDNRLGSDQNPAPLVLLCRQQDQVRLLKKGASDWKMLGAVRSWFELAP